MTIAPRSASSRETVDLPEPIPPVNPATNTAADRIIGLIAPDAELFDPRPTVRLEAARHLTKRHRAKVLAAADEWPEEAPGSANAWLLLVTSKPPAWRDPLITWPDAGLTLGEPHPGFFYPDPLGFWTEVRRWIKVIFRAAEDGWEGPEALAVSALIDVGGDAARLTWARRMLRPACVLFLDEPSWTLASPETGALVRASVPDPHRPGQGYEGWWGREGSVVVGKSPQHPATHRLYSTADMDAFLRLAPLRNR